MSRPYLRWGSRTCRWIAAVAEADAVVLVTAHPNIDYTGLAERASLLIDLRGVTRGIMKESLIRL